MRPRTRLTLFIFLALAVPTLAESQLNASLEVTETALVTLTGLQVVPQEINRGGTADVSLSLENTGNLETGVQANVTILNSTLDQVGLIVFDAFNMTPGETAKLTASWSTGNLSTGSYHAKGTALYDGTTPANEAQANFSIVNPFVPTPSPGGGGGPAPSPTAAPTPEPQPEAHPVVLPEKIVPDNGEIQFTTSIALKEVVAGSPEVDYINLKNEGSKPKIVSLELSGAPNGFVTANKQEFLLQPGEDSVVKIAFVVPKNAPAGDYLIKVSAGDAADKSTDYIVLRVKGVPADYKGAVTAKTVQVNRENGKTTVSLAVINPSAEKVERVQVFDRVPPEVASDPSSITFSESVGVVASVSPLELAWEFTDLQPGEHVTVAYVINTASNNAADYADFAQSTVQTAQYNTAAARDLLGIRQFSIPVFTLGQPSEVTAVIFYGGLDSVNANAYLEVPSNFKVEPDEKQVLLPPRSLRRVTFTVTPLYIEAGGSNLMTLSVFAGDMSVTQVSPFITQLPMAGQIDPLAILAVAVVALAATVLVGRAAARRKTRELEERLGRRQQDERVGYLRQVRDGILGKDW